MELRINPQGIVCGVYDETLDLTLLGEVRIQRASHVEPTATGGWSADLSPVGGPVLGPFAQRSAALVAERKWLEQEWLSQSR